MSLNTSNLLARLPGVASFTLRVTATEALTPSMRRIVFAGATGLDPEPGQDLMFSIPDGDDHYRRRYTIRFYAGDSVTVDFVLHGDGPGARWAGAATPGDQLDALGPRGKIVLDPQADWHLLCGDESAVPVTFAMIEALPAAAKAIVLLEVEHELAPGPVQCDLDLRFLPRTGAPGQGTALADACEALVLPAGTGHAYLNGELRQVAAARKVLADKGVATIEHKAYWRLGVANAAHGEPAREQ